MKYLTLKEWDIQMFSKPHSLRTLRTWAKGGLINPRPIKVGREWLVLPNAKYVVCMKVVNTDPVIQEILNDVTPPSH